MLDKIKVLKRYEKEKVFAHRSFVGPMLDYIVNDFEKADWLFQMQVLAEWWFVIVQKTQRKCLKFQLKYALNEDEVLNCQWLRAKTQIQTKQLQGKFCTHVARHWNKDAERFGWRFQRRKNWFSLCTICFWLVWCKRLKKLYIGQVIKRHNLLQTLTAKWT